MGKLVCNEDKHEVTACSSRKTCELAAGNRKRLRLLGHVVEDGGGVGVVGGQQEALRQLGLFDSQLLLCNCNLDFYE